MLDGGGVFSQLTVLRPDASEASDFLDPLAERIGAMCRGMSIWRRRKWCELEISSLWAHYFYGFIDGKSWCAKHVCAAVSHVHVTALLDSDSNLKQNCYFSRIPMAGQYFLAFLLASCFLWQDTSHSLSTQQELVTRASASLDSVLLLDKSFLGTSNSTCEYT